MVTARRPRPSPSKRRSKAGAGPMRTASPLMWTFSRFGYKWGVARRWSARSDFDSQRRRSTMAHPNRALPLEVPASAGKREQSDDDRDPGAGLRVVDSVGRSCVGCLGRRGYRAVRLTRAGVVAHRRAILQCGVGLRVGPRRPSQVNRWTMRLSFWPQSTSREQRSVCAVHDSAGGRVANRSVVPAPLLVPCV